MTPLSPQSSWAQLVTAQLVTQTGVQLHKAGFLMLSELPLAPTEDSLKVTWKFERMPKALERGSRCGQQK